MLHIRLNSVEHRSYIEQDSARQKYYLYDYTDIYGYAQVTHAVHIGITVGIVIKLLSSYSME
jgi:hypothetical protein